MADTRVVIVVRDGEPATAYAEALSRIGVAFEIAHSFHDMARLLMERSYNGLVIDIFTLVRSSKEEKVIAYECFNLFPVLRVKWEGKKKRIGLSPLEQAFSPDVETALRFFVESRCTGFPARLLRRHPRKALHLNVLFSPDGSFSETSTVKTFTASVGQGGVFLHLTQPCEDGQQVWLRFVDLAPETPVQGSVRWSLPWGATRAIPGVGVHFEALPDELEQELTRLL